MTRPRHEYSHTESAWHNETDERGRVIRRTHVGFRDVSRSGATIELRNLKGKKQ